ncbi:phosphate transport system regulatory protein PhoU, partial [Staphylococcus aureus]
MAIIRQRYQEQLDDLIKELRRLGANVYVSIENG